MTAALAGNQDFVGSVSRSSTATPIPKTWYLLRLHPNYDLKAERQLHNSGISAYVPKEQVTVRAVWNRTRSVQKTVPIFPGSMFIPDFDADIDRLKKHASGIGGFVKCAGSALRISLMTMEEIRRFEAKRDPAQRRKFQVDQDVRIVGGPFNLLEGKIARLDPRYRIAILIEFLGREVQIPMDEDQVEAV